MVRSTVGQPLLRPNSTVSLDSCKVNTQVLYHLHHSFQLRVGWITVFGWICSCTSNPALVSNIIVGLAIFNYPDYVPKRWHVTLFMWAITIFPFLGNFWFRKLINPLEAFGAICHVVFFFASIITLAVLAQKSTVDYVFHTLTHDVSGWTNPAVAWGLGLLTVTYPLSGKTCPGY